MGRWLSKLERLVFKPVMELEHRHRARVEACQVHEKGIGLRVRVQDHRTYRAANQTRIKALATVATD